MTDLCIYHGGSCADGFGSALVVKHHSELNGYECAFVPANYGDTPPDVTGKNVLIVDFSYPRDVIVAMKEQAKSLVVIDHHRTAQAALEGLGDYCIFNMEKSGAVLTWEYLFPECDMPMLFAYIQDRDLWQWKLPDSKEISAGLQVLKMTFDEWQPYLKDYALHDLKIVGSIILDYQAKQIAKATNPDRVAMVDIGGYTVPCVNTPHLISEIGEVLCKDYPFAAIYFDIGDKRIYSLRSDKNGVDVSAVAGRFSGGGHKHAAGFTVPKPVNTSDLWYPTAGKALKAASKYSYSFDNERFEGEFESIEAALAASSNDTVEERTGKETVFIGRNLKPLVSETFPDGDHIIDQMACQAGDIGGEWAENFPDVDKAAEQDLTESLHRMLNIWCDKHEVGINFWQVTDIEEYCFFTGKKVEPQDYEVPSFGEAMNEVVCNAVRDFAQGHELSRVVIAIDGANDELIRERTNWLAINIIKVLDGAEIINSSGYIKEIDASNCDVGIVIYTEGNEECLAGYSADNMLCIAIDGEEVNEKAHRILKGSLTGHGDNHFVTLNSKTGLVEHGSNA